MSETASRFPQRVRKDHLARRPMRGWGAVVCISWVGWVAWLGGCDGSRRTTEGPGEYRTTVNAPLRDTDAAKRLDSEGLEHLAADDLEGAEQAFTKALTADVEYGPAHNNLGKVYYKQGDWYRAATEFDYARKLLPRHAEPVNNLGLVRERAGELDAAVEHYREAMGLEPGNVEYAANLARTMVRRGDRSDELRSLLRQVADRDERAEWSQWAKRQLELMGDG